MKHEDRTSHAQRTTDTHIRHEARHNAIKQTTTNNNQNNYKQTSHEAYQYENKHKQ